MARRGSSAAIDDTKAVEATAAAASSEPPIMRVRRPKRSPMRAMTGRAAMAAMENTARLTPMASPSPPSSFSMNRGITETAIPTNTKKASVAAVTITNGAVTSRGRVGSVTGAMMGHQRPSERVHSPSPAARRMSQGT